MYCIDCQFLTILNLKVFPVFQDFDVVHDYLSTSNPKMQARLRKRGQNGKLSLTLYLYNNSTSTLKAVPLFLPFPKSFNSFCWLLGQYTYMHTLRNETKFNGQIVEVRTSLSVKDYDVIFVLFVDFSLAHHNFY